VVSTVSQKPRRHPLRQGNVSASAAALEPLSLALVELKLKQAVEDREHDFRQAKRLEAKARHTQATAIERNRPALIEQLQRLLHELTETILAKLAELAADLDRQADLAGSVRTIATIDQERTQARGFEPIRSAANRFQNPKAYLAGLRSRAIEVRDVARQRQQPDASESEGEIAA
jgi:hypothetical protein